MDNSDSFSVQFFVLVLELQLFIIRCHFVLCCQTKFDPPLLVRRARRIL
jgi:hypothetical protein